MKLIYLIEEKVVFEPDAFRLWPLNDPQAVVTLYAPVSQCLLLLVQHPLETLSQEVFFEEVWRKNGLYVNANTLYQNIALLRKALHTLSIKTEIIKTIPRQGIKFTGTARILVDKTQEHSLPEKEEKDAEPAQAGAEENNPEKMTSREGLTAKLPAKMLQFIPFIMLTMALFSLFLLMRTENVPRQEDYLRRYNFTGQAEHCHILSSSPDKLQSIHYFAMLSRITGMRCTSNEYVWMSFNNSNRIVSAVKCDKKIRDRSADCAVWMYRESQYE